MKTPCGTGSVLLIIVCGLLFATSASAKTEAHPPSVNGEVALELSASKGDSPSFGRLKAMSGVWRHEYLKTYLPGYLFRADMSFCPYDETEDEAAGSFQQGEINCARRCGMGEKNLAAGFLPEALAEYMTAAEKGCPYTVQGCRARVGMMKADLAMGRLDEARRLFLRLSRKYDVADDDLFKLVGGILAAIDEHYDQALHGFTKAGTNWHLVANVEGIAAYTLMQVGRYEDARNVFRVTMHSPWTAVRDFGVLGLADCTLALGKWGEAEPLYESLVKEKSPLGLLGMAEFKTRQGKLKEAREILEKLLVSSGRDTWKGIALTYLMSLNAKPEQWAESLLLAEGGKGLVLPMYWRNALDMRTAEALGNGIRSLWQRDAHEELLILAEKWRGHQKALRQEVQLLIGQAYEQAGLKSAALEVYSRLSEDPEALFHGARLAWKCGEYQTAQTLLEKYLDTKSGDRRNDARLLLACVHARQNRLDEAKRSLRGMGRVEDPAILIALASVEASMGMEDLAIDHLQTALEDAVISDEEREHLLYLLAQLNYQQGRFHKALRCFRLAAGRDGSEPAIMAEPMEVLCLARIGKPGDARTLLGKIPKDEESNLVGEILDAEDLLERLRKKGYGY